MLSLPNKVVEERRCSYCFKTKPVDEFSFEHIWPNGLGGDYLPAPWSTGLVCRTCNNLAGRFVDGEFLKSWFGSQERASAARDYRDPADPTKVIEPPTYMGPFDHDELLADEIAEMWIGPAGAHMVHIRPANLDPVWDVYAGGKPTRKRALWGFAFLAFTSTQDYWVKSALLSFEQHFAFARRVSVNSNAPPGFEEIDAADANQARMIRIARSVDGGATVNFRMNMDLGNRLLAKVALGLGREILGDDFMKTPYAAVLRNAVWERDADVRAELPIYGVGYLSGTQMGNLAAENLTWKGAWTLHLWRMKEGLALVVGTPSQKVMSIVVSDDGDLVERTKMRFNAGETYVTAPAMKRAVGPEKFINYIAFLHGGVSHVGLQALADARCDPDSLPPM